MTTYQVQLRDFRSARISRIVCCGLDRDGSIRAGHRAFETHRHRGVTFRMYEETGTKALCIQRFYNGIRLDEYVRLVPEPPPLPPDAPGECNRCYAPTPPEDPDSEWENLCADCTPSLCAQCGTWTNPEDGIVTPEDTWMCLNCEFPDGAA